MSLSEAIDAYVATEYPNHAGKVGDELRHVLSEGDRIERPWVQHAIYTINKLTDNALSR